MQTITALPINTITPGNNDRTTFPAAHIESLAASIAAEGLHQPIVVRPIAGGIYQIIAGECRYRACKHLGLETVPAIVKAMSDEDAARAMLSENLKRRNLDPMDEAGAYAKWQQQFGWSAAEIAERANVSRDMVVRRLALLELLPDIQAQVRAGTLPLGLAECLAGLDRNNQIAAMRALRESDRLPTVAQFRRMCGQLLAEQQQGSLIDLESLWRENVAAVDAAYQQQKAAKQDRAALEAEVVALRAEVRRAGLVADAAGLVRDLQRAGKRAKGTRAERIAYLLEAATARLDRRSYNAKGGK